MISTLLRNLLLLCAITLLLLDMTRCETAMEKEVRDLLNQIRARANAQQLAYSPTLYNVAKKYAETMYRGNFFSHNGKDGSTMGSRIKAGGYSGWSSIAENIARGQKSAQEVVDSWMNSPGHRANILNPKFNEMSVGVSSSGWYWVQNFGARKGVQVPAVPVARTRAPTAAGPRPAPTPKPNNPNQPQNGMTIFYFQGTKFDQFRGKTYGPVYINNPSGSSFNVEGNTVPGQRFSAKFFGRFKAPSSGYYHFESVSDDGIRVTIGGVEAIENWTPHSPTINRSGPIRLTAGSNYNLKVEYYNSGGPANLQLFYEGPGMNDAVAIPLNLLFPDNKATPQSK